MARRMNTLMRAALLLPLLVFSVSATSWAEFRCRFDGLVRAAACCAGGHAGHADSSSEGGATLKAAACCERAVHTASRPPSELPSQRDVGAAAVVVALPPALGLLPVKAAPDVGVAESHAPSTARPPDGGRALVLRKLAILI